MAEFIAIYSPALAACVLLAALIFLQVLVADVAGILAKHVPGMPVSEGHSSFHFRSVRALANTNETLGLFLLLMACALLLNATAAWVNTLVPVYVGARVLHTVCYYARWGRTRGVVFGVGLAAQAGLLLACVRALF